MLSEKNDNKTIEELEKDFWVSPPSFPTELVKNVFLLRQRRLKDLDSNDIRILISQNVGLKYLIPKAIDFLKDDILHEAMYYPGDLLFAILTTENDYWANNATQLVLFTSLLKASRDQFNIDNENDEVDEELMNLVNSFLSKHDNT